MEKPKNKSDVKEVRYSIDLTVTETCCKRPVWEEKLFGSTHSDEPLLVRL
jgi:hypothetical protein